MAADRDLRINEQIKIPSVRLIDADGSQLGLMTTADALQRAQDAGLDLVEVAPNSRPPVCRILDYGKFKYQQKKKKTQKKVHVTHVKEIRVRPKTDKHDVDFKVRRARQFLERGDKVRIDMLFRGREMAFIDRGRQLVQSFIEQLEDLAKVERPPIMEGRRMTATLSPKPAIAQKAAEKKQAEATEQAPDAPANEQPQDAASPGESAPEQAALVPDAPADEQAREAASSDASVPAQPELTSDAPAAEQSETA